MFALKHQLQTGRRLGRKEPFQMVGKRTFSCVRVGLISLGCLCLAPSGLNHATRVTGTTAGKGAWADAGLRQALDRTAYALKNSGHGTWRGGNAAQRLSLQFNGRGTRLSHPDGSVNFRLTGYGYGGRLRQPAAAMPTGTGNRVEYRRGNLTEWYLNGSQGLEQGFTFARRPGTVRQGEPLEIALAVSGGLRPLQKANDDSVLFESDRGARLRYAGLQAVDARGRVVPSRMVLHRREIRLIVDDRDARYPLVVDPTWTQLTTVLTASNGGRNDNFGISVSVSGNTAVVGAYGKTVGSNNSQGAAYVFTQSGANWTQLAELIASDGAAGDYFGRSVSLSADTAVIGAPYRNGGRGAAYVFVRNGSTWTQQAELTASDGAAAASFGYSVSVSGDTVMVGASGANSGAGTAYVFARNAAGAWSQKQELAGPSGAAGDAFGVSVSMSGATAVIGASGANGRQGAAVVFVSDGSMWIPMTKLTAIDAVAGDCFGQSVSLSGNTAVIGAFNKVVGSNTFQGAAYVFVGSATEVWRQQAELTASAGAAGDHFGWSVSVSGAMAVIGANNANGGVGAAYVFGNNAGVWIQRQDLTVPNGPAGDYFGGSVSVSGPSMLIGATGAGSVLNQGAVYAFAGKVLGTTSFLLGSAAGSPTVLVDDPNGGGWSASSNDFFLHIASGSTGGSGSGIVSFYYDALTGAGTRTGTMTIAGITVTVTQAGTNYIGIGPWGSNPAPAATLVSSGLNAPQGVAVDGFGNVYIADTGNNAIKQWSALTQQVSTLVSGLNAPAGVAVDRSGNVYIADTNNHAVKEWSASTHQVTTLVSSGLGLPEGVAVDGFGNVYIADTANNAIKEWSASTQQLTTLVSSRLMSPKGVAVDASGNVYIADTGNWAIEEWNTSAQQLSVVVPDGLNWPEGAAVDGSGNIYVADTDDNAIKRWQPLTQNLPTLALGLSFPEGVAVDGSGNIYFADTCNNAIKQIPYAFVGPVSLAEPASAGTDSLLPVLPSTAPLTGVFAPTSDQGWLTIGSVSSGVVSFSFSANISIFSRAAHITVLGRQIVVMQAGRVPSPLIAGPKQSQTIAFAALSNMPVSYRQNLVATATSGLAVGFGVSNSSICTVSANADGSNPAVTAVGGGTCTIQASQPGNATYAAAPSVYQSFYAQVAQTIAFPALSSRQFGGAPFTVSATASSGLQTSFNSQTTSVCLVSGAQVSLISVGTCTVQATQAGDTVYWAAATPVNQSFPVTKGSQTITFPAIADQLLSNAPLTTVAPWASSGLPVSFVSLTSAVCTVSGSTVTLVAAGTCTIQATQPGNTNWAAATPVNRSFQVTAAQTAQSIVFATIADQPFGTPPFTLDARASSLLPVSFTSQTTSVCTVSGSTVTLVAVGTCTIQATQPGNATYAAATPVIRNFQVTKASQTITFNQPASTGVGLPPTVLTATASSGLPVSFNSQTSSFCTVSGNLATPVSAGDCIVQATQAGNANWAAATPVNQAFLVLRGQTITFPALADQVLGTAPFVVGATATSGLPVSFNSQTPLVCTVSGSTVTLVAVGTCGIQATQAGDHAYGAATPVTQSFQVTQPGRPVLTAQTIAFNSLADQVLGTAPFVVNATASSGLPVSFAATTPAICTVSISTVTLVAVGTCGIQATQAGNTTYAAATPVTESFQVTPAGRPVLTAQTITFNSLADQVLGAAPFTVGATATSGLPVSFAAITPAICTVSISTVTLVATGTCTIQATQAGDATYAQANPVNRSFAVTSAVPQPTITGVGVSGGGVNIAQNAWISIYGSNLAPASEAAGMVWSNAPSFASGQMPTELQGVAVTVNGKPAYVYFICPTQINVLTPLDSTTGSVAVVVNNGTASSAAYIANLQPVSPGFLRFGDGVHITALHADYGYLGPASMSVPGYAFTPAAPGETILLFGDGFGLPVTSLTAGSDVQTGALPAPWPQVTIGGTPATVIYAGVISPGLYQINVTVPVTAAASDNQVLVSYGGATSPAGALIPVAR
jgi:uncharacterized protein (TIGR03437 family)